MTQRSEPIKTNWLVLSDSDFGRKISLSRSCDQMVSEGQARDIAEEFGKEELTFLYRLEAVYRPASHREIPEYIVENDVVDLGDGFTAYRENCGGSE